MEERTILFPTDFSKRANEALGQVVAFTEKFDYKIIVYHAYHRPIKEGISSSELKLDLERVEQHIAFQFEKLLDHHPGLTNVQYEFRKELGISIDNIVSFTEKEKVDLIIMATKGADGFGEIWGTKTAKIIKSVHVPVLVIPDNAKIDNLRKIGLACDYSETINYKVLHPLVELAESFKLNVNVITLNRDEKNMTNQELANRDQVRELLENVKTSFNFTFDRNVERGVLEYCSRNNIDLISVLPKSYSFIQRLFHESLTEKMAFRSSIPFLVLK